MCMSPSLEERLSLPPSGLSDPELRTELQAAKRRAAGICKVQEAADCTAQTVPGGAAGAEEDEYGGVQCAGCQRGPDGARPGGARARGKQKRAGENGKEKVAFQIVLTIPYIF